jgi:hypothetical protein
MADAGPLNPTHSLLGFRIADDAGVIALPYDRQRGWAES